MKLPRPALDLVLFFTAPLVLLTVALPVGFVMEIGKQAAVTIENRSDRPLRVTPIAMNRKDSELRVLPRTWHPLLPLPAFRTGDLALEPGATLRVGYSARQALPVGLAVREADGALGYLLCEQVVRPVIVLSGRAMAAEAWVSPVMERDSPAYRWTVLLIGPLGTIAFVAAWRARRRPSNVG